MRRIERIVEAVIYVGLALVILYLFVHAVTAVIMGLTS